MFRQGVVEVARGEHAELCAAVAEGAAVPAADPVDVAAIVYLLRPEGWEERLAAVTTHLRDREQQDVTAGQDETVQRLTEQLAVSRTEGRQELAALRAQVAALEADLALTRRQVREQGSRAGRAEQAQRAAERAREQALAVAMAEDAVRDRRVEEALDRAQAAEQALARARQAGRAQDRDDELRLRLLLDTVVQAAAGLRRELALPPGESRPADALQADYARAPGEQGGAQGRGDDDPRLLESLLTLPLAHLLVDGYNVTKTGFGGSTLEQQRARLVSGLVGVVARTGAEVTVVFDGKDGVGVTGPVPRGVRVLFSRSGETADEVLRRLAAHEPRGRVVVVVSSDREVADGVRRSGARPLAAVALVRLLERGGGGALTGSSVGGPS